ncbi:DUF5959 family protein [Actinomadura bangladeshensis]|uniref:Uncharacterized protein n=1 Tax=Actinomadura bangladeshensis TaxID=453573 RepID=A0A4V2XNB1_9ACTN|nr:DUF5959 family protein [Actinomadura bangladeshensis]TDC17446.1 hypothetical protein E1284_09345 [Actinomadura bangladeshensis]
MTEHDTVELIHLADDLGNGVVLRITGQDARSLEGTIEVASYFVSGSINTRVDREDLAAWEKVLDSLAQDDGGAAWREDQRATEIHLDLDDDRVHVAVVDRHSFLVTVELTIEVAEDWLEDHRERLTATRALLPE